MTMAAAVPTKTRFEPTEIAPDTFLVHDHHGEGTAPVCVALNALVIRGREPVVIDTGMMEHREQYLADVFSIVDPEDIRWVFISHDDVDHTGNLNALMAAAPHATLVINWFMAERMGASLEVPAERWRWVGDGESFDAGDRRLLAVRPPVFDSPTTRGLFDTTTGVYWGADAFATPMHAPIPDVADLDPTFWADGMATFDNYISPWLSLVDDGAYQRAVDRVDALRPRAIAGCHTPAIRGAHVARAIALTRRSPGAAYPAQPDHAVLEELQRAIAANAAA